MDLRTTLYPIVREYVGEGFITFIDYGIDLVPYLGQLNQTRKINRVERRIKEFSIQLQRINKLFSSDTMSKEFIQEKVSPIVLSDIIEEHEDAKIVYILNGFENIFINENTNESLIINYYDTLRNLRYEDVRKLYFYAAITDDPFKNVEKGSILDGLSQQIYFKLERLYLVKSAKTWGALEIGPELLPEEDRKVELTAYGIEFMKFITMDFDERRYEEKISKYKLSQEDKVSRNVKAIFG